MAGAGFKLFTTGEVLTSSDANTFLAQQVCMVFDSSSARTTAIGANLAEGMLTYLRDTNAVEVYDGSSFVGFGDITGVTAGTALSGGGAGPGAVTLNADVNGASAVTAIAGDYVLISDTSDSNNTKKALISDIVSLVPAAVVNGTEDNVLSNQVFS